MSALSEANCKPVRLLCSRRAHHTYEVTFTRQPEAAGPRFNYSSRVTDVLRRLEQRKNRRGFGGETLPAATGDVPPSPPPAPRKLAFRELREPGSPRPRYRPEGGDDTLPPRPDSISAGYYDACSRQYSAVDARGPQPPEEEGEEEEDTTPTGTLKTARSKLIQFLQTEEFFDEYSFIALMALMLAHMYRLSHAIFEMGCTAQTILSVVVYVWRFMQARVADILTTCGGPQAAYKCATFCAELVVIFASIVLFLWAVFIPACGLIAVIASKIIYLFT